MGSSHLFHAWWPSASLETAYQPLLPSQRPYPADRVVEIPPKNCSRLILSAFYLDSLFWFDKLDFANAFHEKRIAQVSDSEHEVVFSISDGDHSVVGEDQRVIFVLI